MRMRLFRLSIIAFFPFFSSVVTAQTVLSDQETWNEAHLNALGNISYGGSNPVSIAHNEVKKYGVARFSGDITNGDFHRPDAPQKDRNLSLYIGGLQSVGKFDLSGTFSYNNAKRSDSRWSSTLGLMEDNPFQLADSVYSDQTVESFDLSADGVFNINDRWKAGLRICFTSSRLSDQTDPRPETSMSYFPVTLGTEYRISESITLGLSLDASLYRSDIDYTIINPLDHYQYFLMKGVGDYYRRSSADVQGYEREYKGSTYGGSLQMTSRINAGLSNYLELGYKNSRQDATDEGSTPFKGGDYENGMMTLRDRLMWKDSRMAHNVILSLQYATGEGTWFEQKKMVDTDHANRIYYDVLSSYQIYGSKRFGAQVGYSFMTLKDNGERDLMADVTLGFSNTEKTHYDTQNKKQKGTLLDLQLAVGKSFDMGRVTLDAIVRGGYQAPLNTSFDDASTLLGESIAASYTAPLCQWTYAQAMNIGAQVDLYMPVAKSITCGLTLQGNYQRCLDGCDWAPSLEKTHRTRFEAGVYMKF